LPAGCSKKIAGGELKRVAVAVSAYLEMELIMRSKGFDHNEIVKNILMFKSIPKPGEALLTSDTILNAVRIRANYGLTYFDSLHASTALLYDGVIISVDEDYKRVPGLKGRRPQETLTAAAERLSISRRGCRVVKG
jgi:predicted nucleic acid-binding protein